jgi:hypothetical protein
MYLLTAPVVLVVSCGGKPMTTPEPAWATVYMEPYDWLQRWGPMLHDPLDDYYWWWIGSP